MSSPRKTIVAAILLGILGTAAAAAFWLLGTTSGASWAVRTATRRAAVAIEVGSVSGRLLGDLRLSSIEVRWPSGTATVNSAGYRLRPLSLLGGDISFASLTVEGVSVTIRETEDDRDGQAHAPPPELRWPDAAGIPAWLDGGIDDLRMSRIRVRAPGRDPLVLEDLSAGVAWRDGTLVVRDFAVRFPSARIAGSLAAGFSRPSLRADLSARLEDARDGMERVSLSVDLAPSPFPRGLAGPWRLSFEFSDSPDIRIEGEATWEKNRAELRGISVSLPEQPGVMTGRAGVDISRGNLSAEIRLSIHELDLFPRTGTHTKITGALALSGGPGGYEGDLSLENPGRGISGFRFRGKIEGGGGKISLSPLRGSWIGGELEGGLTLSWAEGFRLEGSLNGRNLDPARIDPGWPGRIRFSLRGSARKTESSPLHAEIDGGLSDSTLRGRVLSGEVHALVDDEGLQVSRLELHGDGFDISAHGRLKDRLAFSADISRLSGLLPGSEGSVRAAGWTRWRDGPAGGDVTVRGKDLVLADIRAESLSFNASWEGKDRPFAVEGEARRIAAGSIRLDSASIAADGTPTEHDIRLSLRWETGEVEGRARGGYRSGTWKGTVVDLSGGGEIGDWSLTEPAALVASTDRVTLSGFHAAGAGGKSLRAEADLSLAPLRGSVDAEWEDIDPALADPWLGDISISGSSSGHARLAWPADGSPTVDFRVTAEGRIRMEEREFRIDTAEAEASWDANGLSARWKITVGDNGALAGSVSSAQPARPGIPEEGEFLAEWSNLDLSLLSPWIPGVRLSGDSTGEVRAGWRKDGRIMLSAQGDLSGTLLRGDLRVTVRSARVTAFGDEEGTRATLTAVLDGGAAVKGAFRSPLPARAGIPQRGTVQVSLESLDLVILSPWIPERAGLAGTLSGKAEGELLPGGKFDVRGEAGVRDGMFAWRGRGTEIEMPLRSADLEWTWRDDTVRGNFSLALEEYGRARGTFALPVPARVPIGMRREGEVSGSLSATLREKGLLPAFFPGMVQESSGTIDLDLTVGGTWGAPDLAGTVSLAGAGAYLPAAGIRLRDLEAKGTLSGREIRIESLRVRSGEGSLEGTAVILLAGWNLSGYEATLKGENFQAADLPEFRMAASPDLSIEGTKDRLQVRGEISVPDLLIYGRQTPPPVRRSDDVMIVDAGGSAETKPPLALDIEVKVVLGKHVLVKAEGIDARLEGSLTLRTDGGQDFTAQGEIRVAEGAYSTYGVRLRITRGRLLFAGGPVERPTLDILAVRNAGDVTAGVQVTGSPQKPSVKLYSEPPMPDTDILSYIVLGHPLGESGEQGDALMLAANALLPMTQSAVLQDRIERRTGIDVLDVKTGEGEGAGSKITVGKYLNPNLYVSYGKSLFTGTSEVTMRYDFLKRWQIESSFGEESGVDLFYKIEFR